MEAPKSIRHEIGGALNGALRFGLHGIKSDLVGSYPLQSAYDSIFEKDSGGFECSGVGEGVGCFDCILKSG
ncbi:hypothetical protein GOBAR_DD00338 [Gossypium barbadense]|nr:hypothetical protein GOBAR_DD00338 [Gossypium barbadense]